MGLLLRQFCTCPVDRFWFTYYKQKQLVFIVFGSFSTENIIFLMILCLKCTAKITWIIYETLLTHQSPSKWFKNPMNVMFNRVNVKPKSVSQSENHILMFWVKNLSCFNSNFPWKQTLITLGILIELTKGTESGPRTLQSILAAIDEEPPMIKGMGRSPDDIMRYKYD